MHRCHRRPPDLWDCDKGQPNSTGGAMGGQRITESWETGNTLMKDMRYCQRLFNDPPSYPPDYVRPAGLFDGPSLDQRSEIQRSYYVATEPMGETEQRLGRKPTTEVAELNHFPYFVLRYFSDEQLVCASRKHFQWGFVSFFLSVYLQWPVYKMLIRTLYRFVCIVYVSVSIVKS